MEILITLHYTSATRNLTHVTLKTNRYLSLAYVYILFMWCSNVWAQNTYFRHLLNVSKSFNCSFPQLVTFFSIWNLSYLWKPELRLATHTHTPPHTHTHTHPHSPPPPHPHPPKSLALAAPTQVLAAAGIRSCELHFILAGCGTTWTKLLIHFPAFSFQLYKTTMNHISVPHWFTLRN